MAERATEAEHRAYREEWTRDRPDIPYGRCWCGCGEKTPLAVQTERRRSVNVAGEPLRYASQKHSMRRNGHERYRVEDRGYETPCWVWQWSTNRKGYGMHACQQAHRDFYKRAKGPIPDGLQLDHLCGVRACVNPDHLEPVTNAENTRRGARAKLTMTKALEIRELADAGWVGIDIAAAYGVTISTVSLIKKRRTWVAA